MILQTGTKTDIQNTDNKLDELDQVSGGRYDQGGFPSGGNFGGISKVELDSKGITDETFY